ncbi:hypothetical protein [Nocardia sp. NPDC051570]|uniref:hypothetical protein n=1 Tax=Nocardia sp. NPDC051570 TaxID=3364324 RepID=UPI0037B9E6FC
MTAADQDRHEDHLGEFAEELRLLAEAVLERVEPVLRRAAAEGRADWDGCSWCPICAAAALVRGEHHDVVAAIAENGTAIVTVLREALAGVPVDPVMPTDFDPDAPQRNSPSTGGGADSGGDADDSPAGDPGTMGGVSDPSDNSAAADRRTGEPNRAGGKSALAAALLGAVTSRTVTASVRRSRPQAGRDPSGFDAPGPRAGFDAPGPRAESGASGSRAGTGASGPRTGAGPRTGGRPGYVSIPVQINR